MRKKVNNRLNGQNSLDLRRIELTEKVQVSFISSQKYSTAAGEVFALHAADLI